MSETDQAVADILNSMPDALNKAFDKVTQAGGVAWDLIITGTSFDGFWELVAFVPATLFVAYVFYKSIIASIFFWRDAKRTKDDSDIGCYLFSLFVSGVILWLLILSSIQLKSAVKKVIMPEVYIAQKVLDYATAKVKQ